MEQTTLKNKSNKYTTTTSKLNALNQINEELDNLHALSKLDTEVVDSISRLTKIEQPLQSLVYAESILNYMALLKQS